ncbi:MAG: hypothetical protein HC828_14095 [Blastochloris sp.]|nr:hypothetical protein [Blastochloris sp.]
MRDVFTGAGGVYAALTTVLVVWVSLAAYLAQMARRAHAMRRSMDAMPDTLPADAQANAKGRLDAD